MAGWPKRAPGVPLNAQAPQPYRPYASVRQRPAAPPVYRPDRATVQGKMTAPPVYRPAPAIQNKPASGGAPPAYRPNLLVQTKPGPKLPQTLPVKFAGPPAVYSPNLGLQPKLSPAPKAPPAPPRLRPTPLAPLAPAVVQRAKSESEEEEEPPLTFKKFIQETGNPALLKLAVDEYDETDVSSAEELSDTELEYTTGKKKVKKTAKIYRLGGRKRAAKVRKAFQTNKGVVGVRTPTGNLFGLKKGWGAGANIFVPQQSTVSGVDLDYGPMAATLSGIGDDKKTARLIRQANAGESLVGKGGTTLERNTIDALVAINQLSEKQRGKRAAMVSSIYPLANVEEGQSTKTMKDVFSKGTHKRDAIFLGSAKARQTGESGTPMDLMGGTKALELVSEGRVNEVKRKRVDRVAQEIRTYHLHHEGDVDTSESSGSESDEEKRLKKRRRRLSNKFTKIQTALIEKHDK